MKLSFIITQDELNSYAELSCDFNPIHQTGLVYGALILAKIEAAIAIQILTIEVQFIRPIFINQLIEVEIQDEKLTVMVKRKRCIQAVIKYQKT